MMSNRQVVDPAAMPLVADHDRADDLAGLDSHKKQVGANRQLAGDILPRIVPGPRQSALFPKPYDGLFIRLGKRTNLHRWRS